jgi:hypothetical protein
MMRKGVIVVVAAGWLAFAGTSGFAKDLHEDE